MLLHEWHRHLTWLSIQLAGPSCHASGPWTAGQCGEKEGSVHPDFMLNRPTDQVTTLKSPKIAYLPCV